MKSLIMLIGVLTVCSHAKSISKRQSGYGGPPPYQQPTAPAPPPAQVVEQPRDSYAEEKFVQQPQESYAEEKFVQQPQESYAEEKFVQQPQESYAEEKFVQQPQESYAEEKFVQQPQESYAEEKFVQQPQESYAEEKFVQKPQESYAEEKFVQQPQESYAEEKFVQQPQESYVEVQETAEVHSTAECPNLPQPEVSPNGCMKWRPIIDDETYCIVDYACAEEKAKAVVNRRKAIRCEYMNPFEHSEPHPDSDDECEDGKPGWELEKDCQCTYLVKERDGNGCTTSYYSLCKIEEEEELVEETEQEVRRAPESDAGYGSDNGGFQQLPVQKPSGDGYPK